jgi:hypothetical protein
MKTKRRWIKSVIETAGKEVPPLPFMRAAKERPLPPRKALA